MERQRTQNSQNNFAKEKQTDFKNYFIAKVIKTVLYWHKDGHIDQWIRIENLEINLYVYGQLIFSKGAQGN